MKFAAAFIALIPLVYAAPAAELVSRAQGAVFVCDDGAFAGHCITFHGANGACVNIPAAFNDVISSVGPDPAQRCFFYVNTGCTGNALGPVRAPGVAHLGTTAFNDNISSFKCIFE
ncbi:hypothetical protein DFH09DRAFT_1375564 [Mycena vulgaris]|nr:hypothetical protein DFH09DRAFT_1375564 [Mycena vulgaris]